MFSMFILFAFESITGNIPLVLELAAPGRKTQTSDYHINKLWYFTNASLFAMNYCGNIYVGHLQGKEGLPF